MAINTLTNTNIQSFRDGIPNLLANSNKIKISDKLQNGLEANQKLNELSPDVVITDRRMPILEGIEATRRISKETPHINYSETN